MPDSRMYYIVGFTIYENDELREKLSTLLESKLPSKHINESCYSVSDPIPVSEMKQKLETICQECRNDGFKFGDKDFIKFYCAACFADHNAESRVKGMINEYLIQL